MSTPLTDEIDELRRHLADAEAELERRQAKIMALTRHRAEWMAQQEPIGFMELDSYGRVIEGCSPDEVDGYRKEYGGKWIPVYAAPVAKPAAQDCVSVPREKLELAIRFLSGELTHAPSWIFVQDMRELLAASKEPKT